MLRPGTVSARFLASTVASPRRSLARSESAGRFPTTAHLASWAGMWPRQPARVGRQAEARDRPTRGDSWLQRYLAVAAIGDLPAVGGSGKRSPGDKVQSDRHDSSPRDCASQCRSTEHLPGRAGRSNAATISFSCSRPGYTPCGTRTRPSRSTHASLRERPEVATRVLDPHELGVLGGERAGSEDLRRGVGPGVGRVAQVGTESVRALEQLAHGAGSAGCTGVVTAAQAPLPAWVYPTRAAATRS